MELGKVCIHLLPICKTTNMIEENNASWYGNKLEINYLKKKIYIFYDSLVLVEVLSIDRRH